eukprot:4217976-Prymnesium_polylepis.2
MIRAWYARGPAVWAWSACGRGVVTLSSPSSLAHACLATASLLPRYCLAGAQERPGGAGGVQELPGQGAGLARDAE